MRRIAIKVYYVSVWWLISLLCATLSCPSTLSQNKTIDRPARKFHEYKIEDMRGHSEQMGLWGAFDDFAKEPEGARLFIIAYSDLPGRARRHVNRAKNYLVRTHGVNPAQVIAVDGGFRENTSVEIWIVPAGARAPIPKPGGTFRHRADEAWKYDEYWLQGWWFGDYGRCCEGEPERLDGFAAVLNENPQARGYMVVHRGTLHCETCLEPGTELRFAKAEKEYLLKEHRVDPSRIIIVNGGRNGGRIQLWVVPNGARLPRVVYSSRPQRKRLTRG